MLEVRKHFYEKRRPESASLVCNLHTFENTSTNGEEILLTRDKNHQLLITSLGKKAKNNCERAKGVNPI